MMGPRPLRALVVDDSILSLGELTRMLEDGGIEVVGEARHGEEALQRVEALRPDVIVLDLQMPRMDGFTFLRLLMARRPTPVIVLSSLARQGEVFKALELGALDFVPKPAQGSLAPVREALLAQCDAVRALRLTNLAGHPVLERDTAELPRVPEPRGLVVVGASTGGPRAVQELLLRLPGDLPVGILVAQHMPEKFTRAFAERLCRTTTHTVSEAADGDLVVAGRVLVAPGGRHLEVRREATVGGFLKVTLAGPEASGYSARHCPSVDRLFASAALAMPRRVCAVVLTGMGADGRDGAREVKAAGGLVLAESAESAVVYGMPAAAQAAGAVDEVLSLPAIAVRLTRFARDA
jgi:two-component system, chemotaxis family, protein-glutamate methylesterase/glutaminase